VNSLYCYLASEGLIFLKRGYLPFLMPQQLPEPWLQEGSCYKSISKPTLSAQDFRNYLQQQYKKLPDHLREMVNFDYFEKQSQGQREQIEQAMLAQKQPLKSAKPLPLERIKDWRILSMFGGWDSLDLWHQNSAAGQGLVIEFDVGKSGFQASSYNDQAQHLSAVQQTASWQPMDDLYYFFNRPNAADINNTEVSSKKSEWRLLRAVKAADRMIAVQKAERAMYRLPAKAVVRIILGYRCSTEYCLQVKTYLSQDINYRHVECVQAQLDPTTLRLQQVAI
jgi:hypothetical protein